MGGKARKTVEGKGQVKEGPAGAGGSKMYATCNVSSCNNVLLDVRKLRPRIREMNVFCRRPLHFLQGTMQAISRLLLVSLLGLCRIISAEPSSQPFNRLVLPQEEEEEGDGGREWGGAPGAGGSNMCPKDACQKSFGMQGGGLGGGLLSLAIKTPEAVASADNKSEAEPRKSGGSQAPSTS